MKRSPLPPRRKPIRRISAKRRATFKRRAEVLSIVNTRDRGCIGAALVIGVPCRGRLEVHELQSRGVRPRGELDPDNCALLCSAHHRWVHDNPALAYENNLKRRSSR